MNKSALTQNMIDGSEERTEAKSGLLAKAAKHPILAGGAVLVGAGLAYATAKALTKSDDTSVASEIHIEETITIDKSPAEIYAFWRDFTNLPRFMNNLETVTVLDSSRSHWVAKGPAGTRVEWDAEIYTEKENELIAWRSLENADVVNAGSVRFQESPDGRSTLVLVTMNYNPPAGKVGATVASLLGANPAQLIKEDLLRLKEKLEARGKPTISGQTFEEHSGV